MRLGSLGETSSVLIALGGIALLMLRVITWHIPLAMIAGALIPAAVLHGLDPGRYADATVHLFSGGLLLGAFFIATDPVTSPSTRAGQLIFGGGCGFLTYVIRTWGGYPEGRGLCRTAGQRLGARHRPLHQAAHLWAHTQRPGAGAPAPSAQGSRMMLETLRSRLDYQAATLGLVALITSAALSLTNRQTHESDR